jgi:Uncharacterized protein conserved in bacteria
MAPSANDMTITFSLKDEKDIQIKRMLTEVYRALEERGYNPIDHIVGYLISDDPTYITNHKNARSIIRKAERDEILGVMLKSYLDL